MNKKQLTQAIIIFAVFLIAGLLMILVPYQIDLDQLATETALQNTLPLIGSVMLTSGLVFFLLEMTRLDREKVN
jgi:drug/metabolite transporter (DMT)-like permease